jgi:hypothetical protein
MKRLSQAGLFCFVGLICISFVLVPGTTTAKTLYDEFSNDYISKVNWKDYDTDGNQTNEFVREIDTAQEVLILKLGTSEAWWPIRNSIAFNRDPDTIDSIKADVKIVAMNNDPTDSATVFARLGGLFYNKNAASPTDETGDIWAEICIGDRGNGLEAWIEVEETIGVDSWSQEAFSVLAGSLSLDTFYTLEISYDGSNGIVFSISGPGISTTTYNFVDDDERLGFSFAKFKGLSAAVHEGGGEFVNGFVHAEFDNVYINDDVAAYDTFEPYDSGENRIDPDKWNKTELVKESKNGYLRLGQRNKGRTVRNRVKLRPRYSDYLEAQVMIESGSYTGNSGGNPNTNPIGRARLSGHIYNQTGVYNGFQDDVWAAIWLQIDKNDNLSAWVWLGASNVDESVYTDVASYEFPTTISLDTYHTLSMSIVGNTIEFKCDSDTWQYTIPGTTVYEPSMPVLYLESRLDAGSDPDDFGYIKTRFDNVYIEDPTYTNLSGDWLLNGSNPQDTPAGCATSFIPPADESVTVSQSGHVLDMTGVDIPGGTIRGIVSGSMVYLGGLSLEDNGTTAMLVDSETEMTSSDAGAGPSTLESSENCSVTFDLSIARDIVGGAGGTDDGGSGGGGGCFISSLKN